MLAAMFSGNYSSVRDTEGRYFIDADGENFLHILNFLRYGCLPPQHTVEKVYREAVYFGLHTLVKELEKCPTILAKIQRNSFKANFPGYHECIESIILGASLQAEGTSSDVKLVLFEKQQKPRNDNFDLSHTCVYEPANGDKSYPVDARLGPWSHKSTEKDLLNCILFDLEDKGFKVTGKYIGNCGYVYETEKCRKSFYNICFHWWKG